MIPKWFPNDFQMVSKCFHAMPCVALYSIHSVMRTTVRFSIFLERKRWGN